MKVAVVSAAALPSPAPNYGGLESIAAYTAEALAGEHEVTLFAAKGSTTEKAQLFETVLPAFEPSRDAPVERAAWETMKDELPKFDVVVDHSHMFFAYQHKLAHPKAKVIKVVHDLYPWAAPPPNSYDVIAGVSKFHARYLEARWGVPVQHLYNGIPTDRLTFSEKKSGGLLFLSRLDPGKGAHTFLDLVEKLGARGTIAGEDDPQKGIDSDYRSTILRRAYQLGVDYLGSVSDAEKKELLAKAGAVVVPLADPYREVFGIWMVEALASGTPVFTLDKGACREILTRESGGVADTEENLLAGMKAWLAGEFEFSSGACRDQARKFDIRESAKAYADTVGSLTR